MINKSCIQADIEINMYRMFMRYKIRTVMFDIVKHVFDLIPVLMFHTLTEYVAVTVVN